MHRYTSFTVLLCVTVLAACGGAQEPDAGSDHAERMATEHADDAPVANPMSEDPGEAGLETGEVVYATVGGAPVTGYLAQPADAIEPPPGVIVIHEWWGLNDNIRTMARKLAAAGYAALAVDLYGGETADAPERARELMTSVDDTQAEDTLRQAYAHLEGVVRSPRIGSVGWCFGGGWSLRTALLFPERLDAAVIYYGHLVTDRERLATLEVPVLGLFGEADQGIPVEDVREFEATLRDLGVDAEIVVYPGAGHAFANPSGRNYQAETATDAWQRTLDFFEVHLQP